MSSVVFKYKLGRGDDDVIEVELPQGAEPTCVDFDYDGFLCVWAVVRTPVIRMEKRRILVRGTGHNIRTVLEEQIEKYLNQFRSDPFIFHAFLLKRG